LKSLYSLISDFFRYCHFLADFGTFSHTDSHTKPCSPRPLNRFTSLHGSLISPRTALWGYQGSADQLKRRERRPLTRSSPRSSRRWAATIPYGLCRGFGVGASRSFFLTYILIYILSWVKFPDLYHALSDHNLGLVNLRLLILFFIAIFKVVRFSNLPSFSPTQTRRSYSPGT